MGLYLIDSTSIPNVNCFILYLHTWIAIHEPLDTWESLKLPPKNESSPTNESEPGQTRKTTKCLTLHSCFTCRMTGSTAIHFGVGTTEEMLAQCWILLTLLQQDFPILHLQEPWSHMESNHGTLWWCQVIAIEAMAMEIASLLIEDGDVPYLCKRLPDGMYFGDNRSTRSLKRVSTN